MPDEAARDTSLPALEYISEDDLHTYDGWLRCQGIDLSTLNEEDAVAVREMFDDAVRRRETAPKVGRMKLARPGDALYAVAIAEGADLWLALWAKRSRRGEFFIFHPTPNGNWNPHASLHADGTFHLKSHDNAVVTARRQRPDSIQGSQHLGAYLGFSPKTAGAVCDRADFREVFVVPPDVLGPRNGTVTIDLLENPDADPLRHPGEEVSRHLFDDAVPHILIRVFR